LVTENGDRKEDPTADIREKLGWNTFKNSETTAEAVAKSEAKLGEGSVGMIQTMFKNSFFPIQHFPDNISVKNKVKRTKSKGSKGSFIDGSIEIESTPGKEVKMTLTYTSIDGQSYNGDFPMRAIDFFEKATKPIIPEEKDDNAKASTVPRILIFVLPHTTRLSQVSIGTETVTTTVPVDRRTRDRSGGTPTADVSGQTTPSPPNPTRTFEKEVSDKKGEKGVYRRMRKFHAVVDKVDETRRNFDSSNKPHEVELKITMTEVGKEQLKDNAEFYSKIIGSTKESTNKAIKSRFVRNKQVSHGKEETDSSEEESRYPVKMDGGPLGLQGKTRIGKQLAESAYNLFF
jgi:hypothetical protein